MRIPDHFAWVSLLLAFATAGPSAAERQLWQANDAEGRSVVLIAEDQATWIQEDEQLRKLDLPDGAWLNRIKLLDSGWVAGGARAVDGGQDLFLLTSEAGRARVRDLPGEATARIRQSVVPLVEEGELVGIAWLEGDQFESLAVRAAALSGGDWGSVETVSPPAPGGQVALSGDVLADGSWLLVWSHHDGEDADTVWSQRRAPGSWTSVQPVHEPNTVPDVTPALIAIDHRALVAWSWYDGRTLRQRVSRLDGDRWADTGYRGPDSSIYPTFLEGPLGPRLVFQTIVPRGWTAIQLDRNGNPGLSASVGEATHMRPTVSDEDDRLRFAWPATAPGGMGRHLSAAWETER